MVKKVAPKQINAKVLKPADFPLIFRSNPRIHPMNTESKSFNISLPYKLCERLKGKGIDIINLEFMKKVEFFNVKHWNRCSIPCGYPEGIIMSFWDREKLVQRPLEHVN